LLARLPERWSEHLPGSENEVQAVCDHAAGGSVRFSVRCVVE